MSTIPGEMSTENIRGEQVVDILAQEILGADGHVTQVGENGATRDSMVFSLRAVGDRIIGDVTNRNAFLDALVNRIAKVVITSKTYRNNLALFKRGMLEYGETIEEVFVKLINPDWFSDDDTQTHPFKKHIPDVVSTFHTLNYRTHYDVTIDNNQLRQAFLSPQGVVDLVNSIINQIYTSVSYDEFTIMKWLIAKGITDETIHVYHTVPPTIENARNLTTQMIRVGRDLLFMSNRFNEAGVLTVTQPENLSFIPTTWGSALFDVNVLSTSFNMEYARVKSNTVLIDDLSLLDEARLTKIFANSGTPYVPFSAAQLGKLLQVYGLIIDREWFMIYDNLIEMGNIYNPEQLYYNYFYHVWKIVSTSPYANAVAFMGDIG